MNEINLKNDVDDLKRSAPNKIDSRNMTTHTFTTTAEESFNHPLGRVPSGYVTVNQSQHAILKGDSTKWTKQKIYLTSSVSNNEVKIIVF